MGAKVTFDTVNRLITVTQAPDANNQVSLDVQIDLYSDMKEDIRNGVFHADPPPFTASQGGVTTPTGFTGQYYFQNNEEGWVIQPYDADHELILVGNLFGVSATKPLFVSRTGRTILLSREFSNLAQGLSNATLAQEMWEYVIEGSLTAEMAMRIMLASGAGKASGAATTNMKFRDLADSKDRIDATVDEFGNRTSVTLDGS